jgi:hypothetical protein
MFPGEFHSSLGPNDPAYLKAQQLAKEYGYTEHYGLRAGIIFGGQKYRELEAERLAATASPAAQTLEAVNQRQAELARKSATSTAAVAAGGTATSTPAPKPKPRPSPQDANGKRKDAAVYAQEVVEWMNQGAA